MSTGQNKTDEKPVVSITKVRDDNVSAAVEEAIELLGGIKSVTEGKERIMLKPNLVAESPAFTTKPEVIRTLARLMQGAGKQVIIGEGSAAAGGFNADKDGVYRTRNQEILDKMQQHVFDQLGYTELARSLGVPLINLHSGELVDVPVANGYVFDKITLHRSLTEIDLLCSVPMMKTHVLATVSLGMKNLIGLYPGTVYYSVRAWLHDHAAQAGSPGIAYEILDMVQANKLGLVVVDGSMAMEGDGPTDGDLVKMGIIVAGTNPLATDMVAAHLMGFEVAEVPTFTCAHGAGMTPKEIGEIDVRGEQMDRVRREFKKPNVVSWTSINQFWGVKEIP
ncbi:MAG: DUF362 domain-containing protein [Anaerolineae bacterium]|nr:DUF362 domain-containing protein [Anaerolineae bacterium]